MILAAPRLFMNGAFTGPAAIVVENGVITEILSSPPANAAHQCTHGFLAPGLIDLHNNGAFGVDFATATPPEWDHAIAALAAHGVTSLLPTIITAPIPALHEAARRIAAAAARHPGIAGLHLEGPYLAANKRGAHRTAWLQPPTTRSLAALLADNHLAAILRLLTLAPELEGGLAAIKTLTQSGYLVALGHTNADAAQMREAAAAGATLVTHVFNAMPPLGHRAPAAPGIALTDPRLAPCLIADGLHVSPEILAIAFAACPRAIAVTDSISLAGQPPGTTQNFGGAPATLRPDGLAYRADNTIAGAAITLDEGLRRLVAAGIPPEIALAAATSRPADAIRRPDLGRIAIGARADIVWFTDTFHVQQVFAAGQPASPPANPRGTETASAELYDLETRPTLAIVETFLAQERAAHLALAATAPVIATLADAIAAKLAAGGRLFYAGAGTSGRLALLDAVECGPTFGIKEGLVIPLLAGGPNAFLKAAEGAEDDADAAIAMLTAHNVSAADALIGIAASGTTPFTLAAITHANHQGALTGAIVNNLATPIAAAAHHAITINSGPEIIAGSTRLSAGTTQKIALTTLSSTIMIRLHKTHGPYMVDLLATNAKLRRRAIRITARIANVPEPQAAAALAQTNHRIKPAILILRLAITAQAAHAALLKTNNNLRAALPPTEDDNRQLTTDN